MKKFTLLMTLTACISLLQAQTSPDYIFGAAGADWVTGVQGTQVTSGVYQWQFTAAATGDQFFKLGETAASADASGFWTNGEGTDMTYTGAGAMWDVYYKANMGDGGAVKFAATTGNYYIIHARKNSADANAKFAIFESPSAIATISSVTQAFVSPNLTVTVNASVAPAAVQKFWVRYTKDNWATSAIAEATVTGTAGTAVIDATGADKVEYYVFTTVQAPAGFTDYDFYTVSLNNNGGKNYAYYAPMVGNYYIPNIPEGQKGFASLSASVTAINAAGLAGDVNFLINGDITETANIGLGVNTNGHKISIRPDVDADRTITFTKTSDNTSPSGHFVLGYTVLTAAWADANTIATNNVTIDGYAVGGTTRRLKFTTASASIASSKLIVIVGTCENTTIKNCIIESKSTGSSAQCIGMVTRKGTAIEVAPNGVLIENNEIYSLASSTGQGINTTSSGTLTTGKTKGLVVKNNIIKAQGRCGWFYYIDGADFIGNELHLTQNGTAATVNYGLWFGTGAAGTYNVNNNKIIVLTTKEASASGSYGTRALSLAGGCTYNISNNTFAGMDRLAAATASVNQCYIFVNGTCNIYNNTFFLPALTVGATPGYYNALQMYSGTTTSVKNNIFITNDDQKVVLISAAPNESDYNVYYLRGGNTNARIIGTFATLAEYQNTNPGKDVNSVYKNVYFANEAAGNLSIAGTSVDDPDLAAPALAAVTTDIFGTTRFAPLVYKGAHEASDLNQPAPTKVFTVLAPVGTEKVYVSGSFTGKNWDVTTPYELTATDYPYEFSGTFACADGVEYKYLSGVANWDYVEATAPGTSLATNRTYTASDEVPYWFASPKVKLNVSFPEGSPIPSNLFVKGSWDSWASGIALTESSTPLSAPGAHLAPALGVSFTGTIGDGTTSVIYSNAQYKFYTTDMADPNWEVIDNNRLAIYPLMNDVIASFTTPLPATSISPATEMNVRIMRTQGGITAEFDGTAAVELYSINGAMIEKTTAYGSYSRDLNPGAYIIRINGKATKFVR